MSGFKRAVRIVAVLWVLSFLSAVPFGVYTKIDFIVYPPGRCLTYFFSKQFNFHKSIVHRQFTNTRLSILCYARKS